MKQNFYNHMLTFEASTPQDLDHALSVKVKERRSFLEVTYGVVYVASPSVTVRSFQLKAKDIKDLEGKIKLEAADLLSLKGSEVSVDFQVTTSSYDEYQGIFACLPATLLKSFIQTLDKYQVVPIKISTVFLHQIDNVLKAQKDVAECCCLVDFYHPSRLYLAVVDGQECKILREIAYENSMEAKQEIIQTLRSACAQSKGKLIHSVYIIGDIENHQDLIESVAKDFGAAVKKNGAANSSMDAGNAEYFEINLAKTYALTFETHRIILSWIHLGTLVFFIMFLVLGFLIAETLYNTIKIKAQHKPTELKKAVYLQRQLEKLQ